MRRATMLAAAAALVMVPAMSQAQKGPRPGGPVMGGPKMPPVSMPRPPVNMPHPPVAMPHPPVNMPRPPVVHPPVVHQPGVRPPVVITRPGFGGTGFGYGFTLPTFWQAPTYVISNYGRYGLPRPYDGYSWSRYYDGAVLTDPYRRVVDWREEVNWGRDGRGYAPVQAYQDRGYDDRPLDYGSQYPSDDDVFTGYDDRQVTESDYRDYDERIDDRRMTDRPDRNGRRDRRTTRIYSDAELARICRRDDGVGGALIGAAVGGIAGNRIAGRGDRTAGSLIGAGVGAVTGAVIDQNEDKRQCRDYLRRMEAQRRAGPPPGYGGGAYPRPGYGPPPGYYPPPAYYPQPQAPQITVINIPGGGGQTTTTTTTTTQIYYETVRVKPRVVKRKVHKPRPKPRCVCR